MITGTMVKQKIQNIKKHRYTHRALVALLAFVFAAGFLTTPFAAADQFDQQIQQLRAQNNQSEAQRQQLRIEATSLQGMIDALQAQINGLQAQINENQAKSDDLQRQIVAAEAELVKQRDLLGQNIKAMYLEGQITTLEMLASSRDLSEFVDKEQYRNSVKDKIKDTLDTVNALKLELKGKKETLEKTLVDQRNMQNQLDLQRAEQARILGLNQAQRSELDAQIKATNGQISELRRKQAAENARLFGNGIRNVPDTTGYPWANYNPFPNETPDPWGMYLRQCVSYTAWKVWRSGRNMPYWGGRGNANQWDDNARAAGIPVDGNPRVGDIAVSNSGFYGHVMYVEHVYDDGRILISQYNAQWDGRYSEAVIYPGSLVFIHFP